MADKKELVATTTEHASQAGGAPQAEESWKPQKTEVLVLVVLMVISLMGALDATVLVTILPDVAQRLNGSTTEAFWAGTSYLLTSAVSQPIYAMITEPIGASGPAVTALGFFATGSIICALASSFPVLLAGRFVQGVGGGGIIALVQIICANMIPLPQRPQWFSLILLAWAIGTITGPFLGSGLVQVASYRWVFWINVPLCGFGILALPFGFKKTGHRNLTLQSLSQVDWLGGCLFILSMTGLLIGFSWAGIQFPWRSYQTVVPITCSSCGLAALLVWELFYARSPFFRRSLFQSVSLCVAYFTAFTQGFILFCVLYYVPFYFAAVHLQSPMSSAVSILPISCTMLPASALTAHAITQRGNFRWAMWAGWFFTIVGAGHLPLLDSETPTSRSVIVFLVLGLGTGMTLSSVNFGIQAMVSWQDAARAAGMYTFFRSVGMSVGVAIGGNVFQNKMASSLRDRDLSDGIAKLAESFIEVLQKMNMNDPNRRNIVSAYVSGFWAVFLTVAIASVISGLASLLIKSSELRRSNQGSHR